MTVKKFMTPMCGQCRVVDSLLKKAGIEYENIDCTLDANQPEVQAYGIQHVPVVIVRDDTGYEQRLNNIADVKAWLKKEGH